MDNTPGRMYDFHRLASYVCRIYIALYRYLAYTIRSS